MNPSDAGCASVLKSILCANVALGNKIRKSVHGKVPTDPNVWQQMRENFEAIVLGDPSFSSKHNIEEALWKLHYKRIEEYRARIRRAALPTKSDAKSDATDVNDPVPAAHVSKIHLEFKAFLSEAFGFYHDLIVKLRDKYGFSVQETAIGTVNSTLQMKRRNLFKPQIHTVLATSLKPSTSITSCLERGEMKEELPHSGTLAAPSAQHQKGPVSPIQSEGKRVATAANPNPEDAADLLRMCLQCGIPKTFTTGKGMVYPVCNDRPPANPNKEAEKKKGSTIKDKEKNKRMKGQSSHASWKSETKMQLRQQFD
ncbi:unnamed protein product [Rhodiola kirilowii]